MSEQTLDPASIQLTEEDRNFRFPIDGVFLVRDKLTGASFMLRARQGMTIPQAIEEHERNKNANPSRE